MLQHHRPNGPSTTRCQSRHVPPWRGWGFVPAIAACTWLSACGSEFDSQMTLTGYRVVGVESTPPEVSPDDEVTLRVHESYDGDSPIEYKWTLCLYSVGAIDEYDCASSDLEYPLGNTAELNVDLGPDGLDLRRVLSELPAFPTEDGVPRSLNDGYPVWLALRSGPDCRDCRHIDTVKRLTLSERADDRRNHNPVIDRFDVSGSREPGATITLSVEVDEPEQYVDSTGYRRREEYLYTWYTTDGKAKPTRSFGEARSSQLRLPDDANAVEVLVTVRDERGGFAVARRNIVVE